MLGNHVYQARAFRADLFDSEPASVTVDDQKVKTPSSSYDAKLLTLSCPDELATIHYTTDGSIPTATSATYSEPLPMTADCTVKFIAVREYFLDSDPAEYVFRVADHQVAAPAMTYDRDALTVTIACATEGAEIRYTIDGEVPTATTGTVYTAPIPVVGNHVYQARAFRADLFDSEPASVTVDDQKVKTPTANFTNRQLTLTCSDPEAQILYTTVPEARAEWTQYTDPIALTENCTVYFYATREYFNDSDQDSYHFRYVEHQVATPIFNFNRESKQIVISCETEGAQIRYSINGDMPTATTGAVYTEPISVVGNHVFRARAFRADLFDSEPAELPIDDQSVAVPTASFSNKLLTLSCPDTDAQILYSIDNSVPTADWILYEQPIALTEDCTVWYYAHLDGFNDAQGVPYVFVYADHQVNAPIFSYDSATRQMTITCGTDGAQIRYTDDGSEPTATTGTVYTGPIDVVGNLIFKAIATRADLFDSEVVEEPVTGQIVAVPTATFANKQLTLSCSDDEASIRYTLDEDQPRSEWTLYNNAPISLTQDCRVFFYASRPNFIDADGEPFDFVYADHQVNAPEFSYDSATRQMTITCGTDGAQIRYTDDGSDPTATTGTVYTGPIDVEGNLTFKAIATRADLFDSEVTSRTVSDQQVPTPVATYAAHQIFLECEDTEAEIHYTLDNTPATAASTLYEQQPIPAEDDVTVRFLAIRSGYRDSEPDSLVFVRNDYTEAAPVFEPDYRGRTLRIAQSDNLQMEVTVDGATDTSAAPVTIDVTPGMTRISARTLASNDDMFDSAEESFDIVFHSAPDINYNHMDHASITPAEGEPQTEGIELYGGFNGDEALISGGVEIGGFGYVRAHAESDLAFRSEPAEERIDHYNTGFEAGARNGDRLVQAFPEGFERNECDTIRVVGETNREDMLFLGSLPNLTLLKLAADSIAEEDYEGVFSGSRIETIASEVYPEGMLKEMPRLTTVIWNSENERMPEGRIAETGNPNILFWTFDKELAPSDAVNKVVFTDGGESGEAESISLQAGYPFNAHLPFTATNAEVTKEFQLPTEIRKPAGWETITLPFTAESILHETAGRITPYAVWTGPEHPMKPFWLYRADAETETGWAADSIMRAGVPYIISMPNNDEYVHAYNLPGKVRFVATDVTLGIDSIPQRVDWTGGAKFVGTFMPVEETGDVYSLNVNELAGEEYLGSAFVTDDETLPFGAYIIGEGLPSRIPVFGDWSGVLTVSADATGIVVETPAPGMIRVSGTRDCQVAIVTPEGALIRTLSLKAGESATAEGLTRGLYIVAGRKVMVR